MPGRYHLEIIVFVCGAAVMILEMTGSRVLAPFLGTSIVVWTSLIGVILLALSAGYFLGGRMADRDPSPKRLGRIILLAALCTAAVAGLKTLLLSFLQENVGMHLASMAATLILFAPPAALLGMVAPFAARLKISDAASSGTAVGRLYALSTLGSIAGTFAAGFFLIGYLGSTNIILVTAAGLAVTSFLAREKPDVPAKIAALVLTGSALAASCVYASRLERLGVYDTDTDYQRVLVYTSRDHISGEAMRVMVTGPSGKQSAVYPERPDELALAYTRHFRLLEHYRPNPERMLVLGGGAYSFPRYALAHYPGVRVDAVELDPGVTRLAREHFFLGGEPGLAVHHQDARAFLNAATGPYDVIILDAFSAHYAIPFHLTTREAVTRARQLLAPGGMVMVNLISAIGGANGQFFRAFNATFATVFPHLRVHPVRSRGADVVQNIILCAFADPPNDAPATDPEVAAMQDYRYTGPIAADMAPLTDDFAPVDRYTLPLALGY